jgi:hypothetical protein
MEKIDQRNTLLIHKNDIVFPTNSNSNLSKIKTFFINKYRNSKKNKQQKKTKDASCQCDILFSNY